MNIHDLFRYLNDAELTQKRDHALDMARDAPKNIFRNADGSASLGNSCAWSDWSNEWMRLAAECDRRGITE